MKLFSNKANDLRRVFRKFSLRVSSLERVSFGPYKISQVPNYGDCKEVEIAYELRYLMGLFYKKKLSVAVEARTERRLLLDRKKQEAIEEPEKSEENDLFLPNP
jgi:hypothetical protein